MNHPFRQGHPHPTPQCPLLPVVLQAMSPFRPQGPVGLTACEAAGQR